MYCQCGNPFQVQLLIACRTDAKDPAFSVTMPLKEVFGEFIRVEEYITAYLACKDAPLVLLYQMCSHLKTVLEILFAKFTLDLLI